MPRLVLGDGVLESCCAHFEDHTTYDDIADPEYLHNENDEAWRIMYHYPEAPAYNLWFLVLQTTWIRSARFRFYVSATENTNSFTCQIRCAPYNIPPESWEFGFVNWFQFARPMGAVWDSAAILGPCPGKITGGTKVGEGTGYKDASLVSTCRQHMRFYAESGTHQQLGFALRAQSEEIVEGNMVRIKDEDAPDQAHLPYIRITYGQPTLSRTRGFGKRMLTRI